MHQGEEHSIQSLWSEGRRQELLRPKDAISPTAPIVCSNNDKRWGEGGRRAPKNVPQTRWTVVSTVETLSNCQRILAPHRAIAPLNDQIVSVPCNRSSITLISRTQQSLISSETYFPARNHQVLPGIWQNHLAQRRGDTLHVRRT